MMNRRIELRAGGMSVIHEVGLHPLEFAVGHGWYVQYRDEQGQLRYGYVVKMDKDRGHLEVMDAMAYPHAPTPFGAWKETIACEAVEIAGNGFDCLGKCSVVDRAGRNVGKREVHTIVKRTEREATMGWIARRGGRAYVDARGDRWQMREMPSRAERQAALDEMAQIRQEAGEYEHRERMA